MAEKKVVLEFVDKATECVMHDVVVEGEALSDLERLAGEEGGFEFGGREFILDDDRVLDIVRRFMSGNLSAVGAISIRPCNPFDALPYKTHTNRELALMLSGAKPFAVFFDDAPDRRELEFVPERLFDPHVDSGKFVKKEVFEFLQGHQVRNVFYALKGEAWRIDTWRLLMKTASKSGWSEGFERMQGSLLGYEDWQNDAHIALMYPK